MVGEALNLQQILFIFRIITTTRGPGDATWGATINDQMIKRGLGVGGQDGGRKRWQRISVLEGPC